MDWSSARIRTRFIEFFKEKKHKAIASAPMVIKNDPSLMFTNAGMNQFKDIFIGNKEAQSSKLVNSQKCLRVSGKHNDLEEVGVDTYHHTMFEMLGNWSFGDYFKEDAIAWAWEFLTEELKVDKELLYVTIFEGDAEDQTELDQEAKSIWAKYVPEERILAFGKKDNFWEMGDTGPCGPCSEIHIDLRSDEEKSKFPGAELVNLDHPEVIEIWNLVFIQYMRDKQGKLSILPQKHVDTGMGLERLCRVLQGKSSNYDIDLFRGIIAHAEEVVGMDYGKSEETDIAFRVIADHLRPVCFSIAEGQLPSNTGPGYVIRRILRRAVRYYYSKLSYEHALLYNLVDDCIETFGGAFGELTSNRDLIKTVIQEEEESFLRTLEQGLKRINTLLKQGSGINGKEAFELYDTFGFPIDLTQLIAQENSAKVDIEGFEKHLAEQRSRSRSSSQKDVSDWTQIHQSEDSKFLGYDQEQCSAKIVKYRTVSEKKKSFVQFVTDQTCFYPEGGGQVGDKGVLKLDAKEFQVWDTKKEGETIIHFCNELPEAALTNDIELLVQSGRRYETAKNHSATHLLHYVLRETLGNHVEQKGSLVHPDYLRFDFSHFSKIDDAALQKIQGRVNELIDSGLNLDEKRSIPIKEAQEAGAMSLFGEKYGDEVRMISYGPSKELCGGIHVKNSNEIGEFIIKSEGSVASGVRRIEAITGKKAKESVKADLEELRQIRMQFPNKASLVDVIVDLKAKEKRTEKELAKLKAQRLSQVAKELSRSFAQKGPINYLIESLELEASAIRELGFMLKNAPEKRFIVLGTRSNDKVVLSVFLSDSLANEEWDAREIINQLSSEIGARGGGQKFFATAGGNKPEGLDLALNKAREML